jgi:5-(carboxyamino)imidazole ribonucleotide synthase
MVVVGAEGFSGNVIYENIENYGNWRRNTTYGKKKRVVEKMGHVTIVNEDMVEELEKSPR